MKFIDFLPVYSARAACGYFGDGELVEELGWINVNGLGRLNRNMFIVKACGHSMESKIKYGDYCVFNRVVVGSREGKIVLVQHNNCYDENYEGSYSIKQYHSEKTIDQETEEWKYSRIILKPLNTNFDTIIIIIIIINVDDIYDESYRVIGEFIGIVDREE